MNRSIDQSPGFPKSVMISINEVICHGIPDAWELEPTVAR